jgi:hypothetical protein
MSERWIVVPRWNEHQHYKHRKGDAWHKEHARQLDDDDYISLPLATRGVLIGLRLMYGRSRSESIGETGARRVLATSDADARRWREHIKRLSDAGFIQVLASKPLAARKQNASPEERREEEIPLTPPSGEDFEDDLDDLDALFTTGYVACRRCGKPVRSRSSCRSCGATPRQAGSNPRELAKPSAYERAEAFTRNAGWQLERLGFLEELALYDLDDEQTQTLETLRSSLSENGRRES